MVEHYQSGNGRLRVLTEIPRISDLEKEMYNNGLLASVRGMYDMIGLSKPMIEVYKYIHRFATTKATVLIVGPIGAGKELVARAFHNYSERRNDVFIVLNSASIQPSIAEAELFGVKRGLYTGSVNRIGDVGYANKGTIFFDEIGEMDTSVQAKLLRLFQEKESKRVGDHEADILDVRIIAATNANLDVRVKEGKFREDLYSRVRKHVINIPALSKRREDIPLLIDYFIGMYTKEHHKFISLDSEARNYLTMLEYPANVRDLQGLIERLIILEGVELPRNGDRNPSMDDTAISNNQKILGVDKLVELIPLHLKLQTDFQDMKYAELKKYLINSLKPAFNEIRGLYNERILEFLQQRIDSLGGNVPKAAESLGIQREYLNYLLRRCRNQLLRPI